MEFGFNCVYWPVETGRGGERRSKAVW